MNNTDETRPKSEKSSCSIYRAAQGGARTCRSATEQYIAVCDGKTSSLNKECSETVEFPKSAIQRQHGQCLSRDAEAFSHHPNRKRKLD